MNLGKLQSLKVMTLDGNKISVLPDEFGQLVRLARLSISVNVLTNLPETIGNLRNVATISANVEYEIGEFIARAMEKVGKEGVITVSDGNTLDNELEVVEGMKLARGYISPYFVADEKTKKCELENPIILIHEKKVSSVETLVRVLEMAVKTNRPLLIVAEDIESDPLTLLILNKHRDGLKVCAIKAPGFGDSRKPNLDDLAIFAGGEKFYAVVPVFQIL